MAAWNRFINMLSYKAESAGMKVIRVDARDTTQECSSCHCIKKRAERLTLEDRTYHCNVLEKETEQQAGYGWANLVTSSSA